MIEGEGSRPAIAGSSEGVITARLSGVIGDAGVSFLYHRISFKLGRGGEMGSKHFTGVKPSALVEVGLKTFVGMGSKTFVATVETPFALPSGSP